MAGLLTKITSPSLTTENFASGIGSVFENIHHNFEKIISTPFLPGPEGARFESHIEPAWEDIGGAWYLTEWGARLSNVIFNVYKTRAEAEAEVGEWLNFVGGETLDEFKDSVARVVKDSKYQSVGDSINVYDAFVPEQDSVPVLYTFVTRNDAGKIETEYIGQYFHYIDPRLHSTQLSSVTWTFEDASCFLAYDYDEQKFYKLESLPVIYYNTNNKDWCWKLNGEYTSISCKGIQGDTGKDGNRMHVVCIKDPVETRINDSNNQFESYRGVVSKVLVAENNNTVWKDINDYKININGGDLALGVTLSRADLNIGSSEIISSVTNESIGTKETKYYALKDGYDNSIADITIRFDDERASIPITYQFVASMLDFNAYKYNLIVNIGIDTQGGLIEHTVTKSIGLDTTTVTDYELRPEEMDVQDVSSAQGITVNLSVERILQEAVYRPHICVCTLSKDETNVYANYTSINVFDRYVWTLEEELKLIGTKTKNGEHWNRTLFMPTEVDDCYHALWNNEGKLNIGPIKNPNVSSPSKASGESILNILYDAIALKNITHNETQPIVIGSINGGNPNVTITQNSGSEPGSIQLNGNVECSKRIDVGDNIIDQNKIITKELSTPIAGEVASETGEGETEPENTYEDLSIIGGNIDFKTNGITIGGVNILPYSCLERTSEAPGKQPFDVESLKECFKITFRAGEDGSRLSSPQSLGRSILNQISQVAECNANRQQAINSIESSVSYNNKRATFNDTFPGLYLKYGGNADDGSLKYSYGNLTFNITPRTTSCRAQLKEAAKNAIGINRADPNIRIVECTANSAKWVYKETVTLTVQTSGDNRPLKDFDYSTTQDLAHVHCAFRCGKLDDGITKVTISDVQGIKTDGYLLNVTNKLKESTDGIKHWKYITIDKNTSGNTTYQYKGLKIKILIEQEGTISIPTGTILWDKNSNAFHYAIPRIQPSSITYPIYTICNRLISNTTNASHYIPAESTSSMVPDGNSTSLSLDIAKTNLRKRTILPALPNSTVIMPGCIAMIDQDASSDSEMPGIEKIGMKLYIGSGIYNYIFSRNTDKEVIEITCNNNVVFSNNQIDQSGSIT